MKFDLNIPTRLHFGCGILEEAVVKEKKLFSGTVLIVSTKNAERLGFTQRLSAALRTISEVENIVVFSDVTSNPKIDEVNRGIDLAISKKTRVVIGLGGGSAMDAAKAIAAGTGMKEHIDRCFFEGIQPNKRTLPIVAIPTTSGTGSELSKSGILSCPEKKIKSGIRGENLYPAAAIVDPELTYTVPFSVTMETGFDVLSHAVESYLSRASNYFTEMLSEQAIAIVSESLPALAANIENHSAREKMSYASMIMGINLGNASTVLPHRMQYPIGALTDTGHGKGLAVLYPAWIELTYHHSIKKFNRIGELLSGNRCRSCQEVLTAFMCFMDQTCGRPKMRELGLSLKDVSRLTGMVTGNIMLDPAGDDNGIVHNIYERSLTN